MCARAHPATSLLSVSPAIRQLIRRPDACVRVAVELDVDHLAQHGNYLLRRLCHRQCGGVHLFQVMMVLGPACSISVRLRMALSCAPLWSCQNLSGSGPRMATPQWSDALVMGDRHGKPHIKVGGGRTVFDARVPVGVDFAAMLCNGWPYVPRRPPACRPRSQTSTRSRMVCCMSATAGRAS
jgi:hypothetical protein